MPNGHMSHAQRSLLGTIYSTLITVGGELSTPRSRKARLAEKIDQVVDRHIDSLIRMRAELLKYDACGKLRSRSWDEEVIRFINSQVANTLSRRDLAAVDKRFDEIAHRVTNRVAEAIARHPLYQ